MDCAGPSTLFEAVVCFGLGGRPEATMHLASDHHTYGA